MLFFVFYHGRRFDNKLTVGSQLMSELLVIITHDEGVGQSW
jgi:hypothetical protein